MYYQWTSKEDFDLWHNALCETLGYPEFQDGKLITDAYTSAFNYEGVFVGFVEDKYADDLTPIDYKSELTIK